MKRLLALIALLAATSPAMSMDFGIGVQVASSIKTIYLPIKVTETFRFEPYFSGYRQTLDSERTGGSASYSGSDIGVGMFAVRPSIENASLIVGLRMARQRQRQDNAADYKSSLSGYILAPTLGFEYFFTKSIAVGAETSVFYSHLKGTESGSFITGDGATRETLQGTTSAVTIKYFF